MRKPNIALYQMKVSEDIEANLKKACDIITGSTEKRVDILVLPEMFICPYNNESFVKNKVTMDSHVVKELGKAAAEAGVWVVAGSIPESDNGKIYNTSLVFNRDGNMVAKHRKVHMYDIDIPGKITFMESKTISAGKDVTIFDTEFGKVGVAICFDIRFAEFFRLYALAGAEMIIVPASFNMTTGPAHWHLTARARALDNQLFIAMCSPARDEDAEYVSYGYSLVVNPWGEIEGELDERESVLVMEVDFHENTEIRGKLPILRSLREDVYHIEKK